jgi:hypothetical protein
MTMVESHGRNNQTKQFMHTLRLAFIALMAATQCSCGSSIDKEESSVIRTYVDSNLKRLFGYDESDDRPLKVIYVSSVTAEFQPRWLEDFSKLGLGVRPDTADSFLRRNDREYDVNSLLSFSIPYVIIPQAKIKRVLDQGGWDSVSREYPALHGILWFSRAGFDKGSTQALLYVISGSRLGAEAWLMLMQKEHGIWREVGRTMIWTD